MYIYSCLLVHIYLFVSAIYIYFFTSAHIIIVVREGEGKF